MAFSRWPFSWRNFIVETRLCSKNVIWHAYRSIAETKIFRLGVTLIYPLYVKKEESISKKLYYGEMEYIALNNESFKLHIQ